MWRAYCSLAGVENRKAFVRTMRGVIEPGGQTVSALDRLYLASHIATLIVWGDNDRIIPVEHAYAAHEAIPDPASRSSPASATSPTPRPPTSSSR